MSIKIENIQTMGWEGALRGMRNPLNSWDKADSAYASDIERTDTNIAAYGTKLSRYDFVIGQNDLALCLKLINAGSEHRKFLRMIHVQMDVIAPLYWWKEADTYKVGTTTNSCSTMHKIAAKEFTLDDFSHEHLIDDQNDFENENGQVSSYKDFLYYDVLDVLNTARRQYLETKDKKYWWQMIQLLPSSYNQRRTWDISMETLLSILHQRKNHKLDEWNKFREICLEQVPYLKEFYEASLKENNNENSQN